MTDPLTTLRDAIEMKVGFDRGKALAALADVEALVEAARAVNGNGVGEFNTRTLTSLLPLRAALARFDKDTPPPQEQP